MISTSTGITKAASTRAEPDSPLAVAPRGAHRPLRRPMRSRASFVALRETIAVASVSEELLELRHGGKAQRCGGVRFHPRHRRRTQRRIEEVGHPPPVPGAVVIDLRRAERIEPLVQQRETAQPRPIFALVGEIDGAAASAPAAEREPPAKEPRRALLAVEVAALLGEAEDDVGLCEVPELPTQPARR